MAAAVASTSSVTRQSESSSVTLRRARAPSSWIRASSSAAASPVTPCPRRPRIRSTRRGGARVLGHRLEPGDAARRTRARRGPAGRRSGRRPRPRRRSSAGRRSSSRTGRSPGTARARDGPSRRRPAPPATPSDPRPAPPRWRPSTGPGRGRRRGGRARSAAWRPRGCWGCRVGSGRGSAAARSGVRRRAAVSSVALAISTTSVRVSSASSARFSSSASRSSSPTSGESSAKRALRESSRARRGARRRLPLARRRLREAFGGARRGRAQGSPGVPSPEESGGSVGSRGVVVAGLLAEHRDVQLADHLLRGAVAGVVQPDPARQRGGGRGEPDVPVGGGSLAQPGQLDRPAGRCRSRRAPRSRNGCRGASRVLRTRLTTRPASPGRHRRRTHRCAGRRSAARPPGSGSPSRSGRCGRRAHRRPGRCRRRRTGSSPRPARSRRRPRTRPSRGTVISCSDIAVSSTLRVSSGIRFSSST